WPRDWSSDVCSSDLFEKFFGQRSAHIFTPADNFSNGLDQFCGSAVFSHVSGCAGAQDAHGVLIFGMHAENQHGKARRRGMELLRSEERRVGKEGGSR